MATAQPRPARPRTFRLPRWALHTTVAALTLSPLLLARVWAMPLAAPLTGLDVRVVSSGPATDTVEFRRASLPALGPLAEDERPLVARIAQYQVAPGDTLNAIAERFGVSAESLLWANAVPDPDHLTTGRDLTVPPVSGVVHTVSPGDSVALLAERYGVSVTPLIQANGLEEP
jgi:hypothetical protein